MSTDLVLGPNGDVSVEVTSSGSLAGWDVRITVATPDLLEFQKPLIGTALFNIPPSFLGRRYRIEVVDLDDEVHFVEDGLIDVLDIGPSFQSFVFTPEGEAGDVQYVHEQETPLATWVIVHGLDRWPNVTVVDSAGSEIKGAVHYTDADTLEVIFSAPFSGRAFVGG